MGAQEAEQNSTVAAAQKIQKQCGMLGLAMRAGKLILGGEMVCEAVRKKKAKLVLLAKDASANTKKKVQNCCTYYQIVCQSLPLSTETLAHALGKESLVAAVAVTDDNFKKALMQDDKQDEN